MADIKVLHISQIKPNHFHVGPPKRNQNGALRIDLNYADPSLAGCVYLLQTPKLRLPFGLGTQEHEGGRANSYSLSMSLDNFKNNSAIEAEFIRGIELLDEHIKNLATENSKVWFKKPMSKNVIDELYRSSIKYSDDWPPLFRCKVPFWNGKFSCDFYDHNRQKTQPENVTNGSNCIALIQLSSLWFMDKQFGCTWTVKQAQTFPQISYNEFLIQGGNDEKDDEMNGDGDSGGDDGIDYDE